MFEKRLRRKPQTAWGTIVMCLLTIHGMTSCVDNNYDLSRDIDLTIGVGGDHLSLPVGNTEKVFMNKIVKPEESDLINVVNHEYHLVKRGNMEGTSTTVDPVVVNAASMKINNISLVSEIDIPQGTDIVNDGVSQSGHFSTAATGIDPAVKEIGRLTALQNAQLTINLQLQGTLQYQQVEVNSLSITFPDFFKFAPDPNLRGNVLTLANQSLQKDQPLKYTLRLEGYDFMNWNADKRKVTDGRFDISSQVNVKGSVKVTEVVGSGTLDFRPTIEVSPMQVTEVFGLIQPEMNPVTTGVELNDLPSFLQDEQVTLDIDNPVFMFTASNPLSTPIELDGVLTPQGGAVEHGTAVELGSGYGKTPVVLEPNSVNRIALVRKDSTIEGAKVIVVDNLNDLLKKIPSRISVGLTPSVKSSDYFSVSLGKTYEISNPSYDVDVPFVFGQGLTIVYNDSISNLGGDLDDIRVNRLNVNLTAHSTVPLQLAFQPEHILLKDASGKILEGVNVSVEGNIAESSDGETETESKVTLKLTTADPKILSKLDRITFSVKATPESAAANHVPLKETQWLQLSDISLTVPGGVQVDLN